MKGFDNLKIKSAVKARNKFDLSHSHLTTMDFGQIVPLLVEETIPGDKFSINAEYFSRMAPLVKPTYGKFQFKTVAGFVPYHQIAEDAEAYLAGKTTFEGQTPKLRHFTLEAWHGFVKGLNDSSASPTAANCDYSYVDSSGTNTYVQFTAIGKYYVKVLNALGYALPQGVDEQSTSTWYTTMRTGKLSAMPLLAFCKLYNDYMSQSQRYNTSYLSDLLHRFKHGLAYSGEWNNTTGQITAAGILHLIQNVFLNYENDYFTSAWQNPNCALNSVESVSSVPVPPAGSYPNISANQNSTFATISNNTLPQRVLDFLRSFDDWIRRNNYSGSRAVQQVFSRFGIKSDDYRSNYAHVIKTDSMPIQVGDVTASAATNPAPGQTVGLGDYAGKGIMSAKGGFSFDCSDYGVLFILGYFTVVPMNSYGYDRRVLRNTPLDFYNPEFDGLGADAISVSEVFENPRGVAESDSTLGNAVFGFTERYNSYRFGRDVITGEFRNYYPGNDMNTWHTGRLLNDVRKLGYLVAQSSSVNTLENTGSQYNRIFSVTGSYIDHFYLTCKFNVDAIRPILNLNQVPRLGEGDTVVPRNGNVIS